MVGARLSGTDFPFSRSAAHDQEKTFIESDDTTPIQDREGAARAELR